VDPEDWEARIEAASAGSPEMKGLLMGSQLWRDWFAGMIEVDQDAWPAFVEKACGRPLDHVNTIDLPPGVKVTTWNTPLRFAFGLTPAGQTAVPEANAGPSEPNESTGNPTEDP
jgi:hypothetical protein